MIRVLAAATLALAPVAGALDAQVNTERLRRTDVEQGLAGQAGLDLTVRAGNVELVLLAPSVRIDVRSARWNTFLVTQADFGWQRGERFSNQALAHLRLGYRAAEPLVLEWFAQGDYDRSRRLTLRALTGAGPRLLLVRTPAWEAALGTAYMFEHEELDLPAGAVHASRTDAHRWSSYVTVQGRAGDRLAAVVTAYAQPRLDAFADVRMLGDARLAVQLAGALGLQVSGLVRWDGRPPDGTDGLDLTVRTGVAVEW